MKVRATETGYYDNRVRYTGEVFDVGDGETATWFIPIHEDKPKDKKEHEKKPA